MAETLSELGPGLHVYTAMAALEHAGRLAAELRADLCVTVDEADAVLAQRRALPDIQLGDLAELRALAERVVTADRIVAETRLRAATEVAERLAETGAGMAIHPVTIRERADALVHARVQLQQAEQLLVANDELVAEAAERAANAPVPVAPAAPEPAHAASAPARKRGLLARFRKGRLDASNDTTESSDILRQMSASTDEAFGARRAAEVRDDQRTLLEVRRGSAEEQVRVAERAWQELAGEGVEPEDVEDVVRRYDPQHQEALVVAEDTIHVRAVSRLLQNAIERWNEAWARLGLEAPEPANAGTVVDDLTRSLGRPIVVAGAAIDRALDLAEELSSTAVVVVEDGVLTIPDATMPEPQGPGIEDQPVDDVS